MTTLSSPSAPQKRAWANGRSAEIHSTTVSGLSLARALKVRTDCAQVGVSMDGKMLSTLRLPAKSARVRSARSLSVRRKSGALLPLAGNSPLVGTGLPCRWVVAMRVSFGVSSASDRALHGRGPATFFQAAAARAERSSGLARDCGVYLPRGHMTRGGLHMSRLVVEEKIGLKFAQERPLIQPAKKHGFINGDVPVHQGADGALVRRSAARGDQRGAQTHGGGAIGARLLQAVQGFEQGLEWARRQRQRGLAGFVLLESGQTFGLENALSFVGEQHRVTVEGDAHFIGMRLGRTRRLGVNLRRRIAGVQRSANIVWLGRQKQMGLQSV